MDIATNENTAMINAINGKKGYIGTLNGLSNCGSFFLNRSNAIMDTIYNVNAPKTEMVMISDVFPVSKAIIPIAIFTSNAFDGVRNRGWIFPKKAGANFTLPNSKTDLPAASMMP